MQQVNADWQPVGLGVLIAKIDSSVPHLLTLHTQEKLMCSINA